MQERTKVGYALNRLDDSDAYAYKMDITDQKMKLGRKVRDLRLARELSRVELGFMIGSGKSQIWAIENAKTNVKLETLCKLADALSVSVRDLVDF